MASGQPQAADLYGEFLSELWPHQPVLASELGLTQYDSELGDFSAAGFEARSRFSRQWAARLDELGWASLVPPGADGNHGAGKGPSADDQPTEGTGLGADDIIDAKLLSAHLAGDLVTDEWERWRKDPDLYVGPCTGGVAILFIHRLRPEAELVEAACARLGQVKAALGYGRAQLGAEVASSTLVDRGRRAALAAADFFTTSLLQEVTDDGLRAKLAGSAGEAAEAMRDFAGYLGELSEHAQGSFAIGEQQFSALLQRRELLELNTSELHSVGERAYAALDGEMAEMALRVLPDAEGWREVTESLTALRPGTPEELIDGYRRSCQEARDFLVERQLVTLPEGEECLVQASPVFLRPVLSVASYQQPAAFASGVQGRFYVPYPPDGSSEEEVAELLADNSWATVPTIAVHEAYPGHHWQLTWSKDNPRPLRHALNTPYFSEGWALYAEAMMRRQGFFRAPEQELAHLQARIFRAARIMADTGLHSGDMTFDEGVAFMIDRVGLTPVVARSEVSRYCAWPTQASSYLTGALELDRLLQRWTEEARGSLCEFHDRVASSPGLPLPLAALELFGPG